MKFFLPVTLWLYCLFFGSNLAAQLKAEAALQKVDEKFPQEKIHLFLNKEAFVAGETIWMKTYLFSGNVQSNISKTLYVELLDEQKQAVSQLLVPLVNAMGEASLTLPANLPEGNYFLHAYTKWMLNFNESFHYLYHIPVYNPASTKRLAPKTVSWTAAVYPESGTLLAERENKMTVRLTAKGSLPQSWQGYITEENLPEKKLVHFTSLNAQVATLQFKPQTRKTYAVHVFDNSGNRSVVTLRSSTQGAALKARQQGRFLQVEMIFQGKANGGFDHKLVLASQGQLIYSGQIKKTDPVSKIAIPVDKLQSGIVQLTLFDEAERPVAERLVFLQTDAEPSVSMSRPVASFASRGMNEWLLATDTSLLSSYAVSVTDASLTASRKRSIKSDLWLGDFTSGIHHPQEYFSGDSVHTEALDALLVTEKWKRYQWEEILVDRFPAIVHEPEGYLSFKALATNKGQPVREQKLNFLFKLKDSSLQLSQVTTNKNGEFFLRDVAVYDSVLVYYRPTNAKTAVKEVTLQVQRENRFFPYTGMLPHSPFVLGERNSVKPPVFVERVVSQMENQKKAGQNRNVLETVTVKTKLKSPKEQLEEKLSTGLFQTDNQYVFDFVNEDQGVLAYNNIFDWLEGRVAGLNFTILPEDRDDPVTGDLIPAGQRIPMMRDGIPTIYVDEFLTGITSVQSLSISDIAMVKVIRGYFVGANGGGGGNGAIAIYTKRPEMRPDNRRNRAAAGALVGYSPLQVYTGVDYANDQMAATANDTRQQLHWATQLAPDAAGRLKLRFYNNDQASGVNVTVTGFTKDARPVYIEKEVKKP